MKKSNIFLLSIFALFIGIFSIRLFSSIMPELNLEVNTTQQEIEDKAKAFAEELGFEGYNFSGTISSEGSYIEYARFKLDGVKSLNENIERGIHPSYWSFRFFKEDEIKELNLDLDLEGNRLGFSIKVPEDEVIKDLGEVKSRNIARKIFNKWNNNHSNYKEVESSSEKELNNKKYTFVYESDFNLKDAKHRYSVSVIGDKVTSLFSWVKIPEAFTKEYNEIRSKNMVATSIAWFFDVALGLLLFAVFLYYLNKKRIAINFTIKVILFFVIGYFLSDISNIKSLLSYFYDTDIPMVSFIVKKLFNNLSGSFMYISFFFVLISSTIALDEEAFPNHISFKQIFNKKFLASKEFLMLNFKGYWIGLIKLAAATGFYIFAHKIGWKTGIGSISSSFNEYFPYLSNFITSCQAGFFEELFFRVLIIALAVLLSKKYGKKVIVFAFIFQAIHFGAAHANYPSTPYYFRIVELFLPSVFVYGLAYWFYGLYVGIIAHFFYDYILFNLGIFDSVKYFGLFSYSLTIALGLVPFIIHYYYAYVKKIAPEVVYNKDVKTQTSSMAPVNFDNKKKDVNSLLIMVLGVLLLYNTLDNRSSIDTYRIRHSAEKVLEEKGFTKDHLLINFHNERDNYGKSLLKSTNDFSIDYERALKENLIGSYVIVKTKDVIKNIEHRVALNRKGELLGFYSNYREDIALPSISRIKAKDLAIKAAKSLYKEDKLKEISIIKNSRAKRDDWNITLEISKNERIFVGIAGDKVVTINKFLHFDEQVRKNFNKITFNFSIIKDVLRFVMILALVTFAILGFYNLDFSFTKFSLRFSIIFLIAFIVNLLNKFSDFYNGISVHSDLYTSISMYIVRALLFTSIQSIVFFIFMMFYKSLKAEQSVGVDRKLLPSLFFASTALWLTNILNNVFIKDSIEIFNGSFASVTYFTSLISSFFILGFILMIFSYISRYFKSNLLSLIMFAALAGTHFASSYSFVVSYKIFGIATLLIALILFGSYQLGWKDDPSSAFVGVFLFLLANNLFNLMDLRLTLGLLAFIFVSSYFLFESPLKKDK